MNGRACPDDSELLAWLQGLAGEQEPFLTSHIDDCPQCQLGLARIDGQAAVTGDDLLPDLRRRPPTDPVEAEPACAAAARRAALLYRDEAGAVGPEATANEPPARLGPYQILEVLGRGGMGVVYKALHEKLDRVAAVKVLPAEKMRRPGAVARFEREMKAVARLAHPNVVTAHDAAEQDGLHYLVLEYVDGVDLRSIVVSRGPLPVAEAVWYVIQAARGLKFAHEQGIIHRDVKPSNLMLDRAGNVKLLDLGLARFDGEPAAPDDPPEPGGITDTAVSDLTAPGVVMGTADFIAPEQANSSHEVDGRADIYSLGCTLYFLLTGRVPYDGDTVLRKLAAHHESPIPALREACPGASAALEPVFAKMVAKRPDERFGSMAEVIRQLEQAAPRPTPAGATTDDAARGSGSVPAGGPGPHRRRQWAVVGVAVALLAGSLGLGVDHFRKQTEDQPDPPPVVSRITPSDGEVELLRLVKLPDDTIRGVWKQSDGGLRVANRPETALLALPVAIDGSYRLTFEFCRGDGREGPGVVFPVGVGHARFALDNFPNDGGITGIDQIHGLGLDALQLDGTSTREFHVQDGKQYVVGVRVVLGGEEQVSVDARVDGRQVAGYSGPRMALGVHPLLDSGRERAPGLTAFGSDIVFHSARLEMITGEAQLLRPGE